MTILTASNPNQHLSTIDRLNLFKALSYSKSFAIITHKRPDGDAISSSLAMFWFLIEHGNNVDNIDVIIPEFSDDFSFIPGIQYIKSAPTKTKYDIVLVVDCVLPQFIACNSVLQCSDTIIYFDHHEAIPENASLSILDSKAPSCTCLLYRTLTCTSYNYLNCIAIGLLSDTSNLTLNVCEEATYVTDQLGKMGVDLKSLSEKLSSKSARTQELANLVISRGFFEKGTIFCSYLQQSDFLDAEKSLTLVNHKAIIHELQQTVPFTFLILFIENDKGEWKGSLRSSRSDIDLNAICMKLVQEGKLLKGGGHPYSSGCTATGNVNDLFKLFLSELSE